MTDETKEDTRKHIDKVFWLLSCFRDELFRRGADHDGSKLESPEAGAFAEHCPKLTNTIYGSDEYKRGLREMKPALDHHYSKNRHHPEYFVGGIDGMNLVDIVEMLCDWKAATLRQKDGDLRRSIEINVKRFGLSPQLKRIFLNTVDILNSFSGEKE